MAKQYWYVSSQRATEHIGILFNQHITVHSQLGVSLSRLFEQTVTVSLRAACSSCRSSLLFEGSISGRSSYSNVFLHSITFYPLKHHIGIKSRCFSHSVRMTSHNHNLLHCNSYSSCIFSTVLYICMRKEDKKSVCWVKDS